MKLGNPILVTEGVFQVRAIGTRVTVLVDGGQALLVDAGMRGSAAMIAGGLEAIGISMNMVRTLVITHHHPDHAAGAAELVAGRDISVMAHRSEANIIAGREQMPNPIRNRLMARLATPVIDLVAGSPLEVDVELEDGDAIPFPSPVRVVHLPGHTAGSIALFLPDKGLLIVGDALQYKFGLKLNPPAAGVTKDIKQAMASLNKLLDLDFDVICFSHFPPMRTGAHAALRSMMGQQASQTHQGVTKETLRRTVFDSASHDTSDAKGY